jgi:hypothetical protein
MTCTKPLLLKLALTRSAAMACVRFGGYRVGHTKSPRLIPTPS